MADFLRHVGRFCASELKKHLLHIEERYKFNVPYRKADEIQLVNKIAERDILLTL